ncbi:hypothetical protein CUC08_Gglean000709 [Alternaria sp. MG1]|jgi:hypothetical protein|uniref:uncharacterized protein n=1 Tax=Alternaria postmessia TaxID=1187938 RepID=UPI000EEC0780|nr:uncharacterized protein J4E82_004853 [Alternaria postmessia]KAI5376359.1 hypothetical protein J4E82_004853 [Alternaria postmessia]RII21547.1 hypothetical protein CUC08_Gglean000709 [Alternaria sp. MG1]RYN89451.1 hypothetical protein AA0120_g6474 [Alternaria tenuissima]
MHFQKLAIVFALSAIGLAQDVDNDDVPMQCRDVCASVVTLTRDCDNSTNDDAAERQCICNAQNANTAIPLCAACITQNGGELDNDVSDIVRECSFSTTSYNPSAASTAPPASASGTSVGSVTSMVSMTSAMSNASSAAPTTTMSGATSGSSAASNAASATSGTGGAGGAQQTTNGAPAPTMAAAAIGLGGVLGVAGLLL